MKRLQRTINDEEVKKFILAAAELRTRNMQRKHNTDSLSMSNLFTDEDGQVTMDTGQSDGEEEGSGSNKTEEGELVTDESVLLISSDDEFQSSWLLEYAKLDYKFVFIAKSLMCC